MVSNAQLEEFCNDDDVFHMLLTVSGISIVVASSHALVALSLSIFHTDPHHSPPNGFLMVYTAITNLSLRSPDLP